VIDEETHKHTQIYEMKWKFFASLADRSENDHDWWMSLALYLGSKRWRERISPGKSTSLLKKTGKIVLQVVFSRAIS
jgi:endo-1,4-beta-D-glucanase Y